MTEPTVEFDPNWEICRINGVKVPAVGKVLKLACGALYPWLKEAVDPMKEARMAKGVALHSVMERNDLGTLDPDEVETWQEPYLVGQNLFRQHVGVDRWKYVEKKVASPEEMFWGKLDRATDEAVYDMKTGRSRQAYYKIQVAGYCILHRVKLGYVVYIPEDGRFTPERDIIPVTEEDFEAFRMALKLSRRAA